MFTTRGWMSLALVANLFGTVLLFFSFQAISSSAQMIPAENGQVTVCLNHKVLFTTLGDNRFFLPGGPCPVSSDVHALAIVVIEKPYLVTVGFLLILAGFSLQLLALLKTPK